MTKHTPGPWRWSANCREVVAPGKSICRIDPGMLISFHAPDESERLANAQLIAAAPDLLEALEIAEAFLARQPQTIDVSGVLGEVQAAIAKAKGERP